MVAQPTRATVTSDTAGSPPCPRARRLALARVGWVAVTALILLLFAAGVPVLFAQLQTACAGAACRQPQLSPEAVRVLRQHGLSLRFYATYFIVLEAVFVLSFCAIAATIVRHRRRDPLALFGATMLVLVGGTAFTETTTVLEQRSSAWWWLVTVLSFLGSAMLVPFCYRFPDGRFVPRWTRPVAVAWVALCAVGFFSPPDFALNQAPNNRSHLFPLAAFGFVGSALVAQVYRYRRVSTPLQRQQTKWVACGFAAAFTGFFIGIFVIEPRIQGADPGAILFRFLGLTDFYFFLILIPLSLGVAILRHRLWDIDVLINRSLVYGGLTACIVVIYVLVVGYLGTLFRTGDNLVISLIATGLVAVLFQLLRARLQAGVNRLLYGERDEPYAVLARLGRRLEGTLVPEAMLPTIVETVAEALKLPYAAIALKQGDGVTPVASSGAPVDGLLRLPLVYQHEPVGELLLAPRAPGEAFSPADRRLLDDLARQAGIAAHAVRLTAALQRSRAQLVTAREEERRRLRRDLHDGLGPALSSVMLKVGAARRQLPPDSPADPLLAEVRDDVRAVVADVRRLVYALRPPALDQLGLAPAIRRYAEECGAHSESTRGSGLQAQVETPEALPPLPAAVEVAAYRIAQEAVTNVVRHANARTCAIRLSLDRADSASGDVGPLGARTLTLEVSDDGVGLRPEHGTGVGLTAMRERAAELGGACTIEALPAGGTRVLARLPIAREA